MREYVPGIPRTLVNYLRRGVGSDSRIIATPKGTEVRVSLPQQSSLKMHKIVKMRLLLYYVLTLGFIIKLYKTH